MDKTPSAHPPNPKRPRLDAIRIADAASRYTTAVLTGVAGFTVAVMCVATVLQVFCRYVIDSALYWPEEVARASLVWLTFTGAAVGVRHGTHVAITAVHRRLPGRLRAVADILTALVIAFIGYAMFDLGWAVAELTRGDTSASLDVSLFWYRLAIPIGGIGVMVNALPHLLRAIAALRNPTEVEAVLLGSDRGVV